MTANKSDTDKPEPTTGFELAPIGICVSRNRIIACCNDVFATQFGYTQRELVGQSLAVLYPSREEFDRIGARGLAAMQKTGTYADERLMKRRNGDIFWVRARGQSLSPENPYAHAVWIFEDMGRTPSTEESLSPREREVASLLVTGKTNKEIAHMLHISPRTVEAHRARLMERLGARSATELIRRLLGPAVI